MDYNDGPGIQHVAYFTDDIFTAVENLKARGVQFIHIPTYYYTDLNRRMEEDRFCGISNHVFENVKDSCRFENISYFVLVLGKTFGNFD